MLSHTSHRTSLNDHNESPQEHTTNIVRMDQDWTPVVLQKTTKQKVAGMSSAHAVAAQKMAGVMTTEKKFDAAQNKSAHSASAARVVDKRKAHELHGKYSNNFTSAVGTLARERTYLGAQGATLQHGLLVEQALLVDVQARLHVVQRRAHHVQALEEVVVELRHVGAICVSLPQWRTESVKDIRSTSNTSRNE
jgi:hypothetical protein